MLELVEHFTNLQGEGKYSGRFAIFFRFAGCNLRCKGFGCEEISPKTGELLVGCDTIRATYSNHYSNTKINTHKELLELIGDFQNKPIIVITGGEPLLHYKDKIFYNFIKELLLLKFEVHFETNGSILVDFEKYPEYKQCVFCISVKLSHSGESREKRLNFDALKVIKDYSKDSFYKFVISKEYNPKIEIDEILQKAPNEIYCMPLGKNKEELEKNALFTVNFCIHNGYNYSDRLHIRIWNDKVGV